MTAAGDTTLDQIFTVLADVCREIPGITTALIDPPSTLSGPQLPMAVPFPPSAIPSIRDRTAGTVNWIHNPELVVFVTPQAGNYSRELPLVRRLIEVVPSAIERAWLSRTAFGPRVRKVQVNTVVTGLRDYGRDANQEPATYHCITYTLEIQVRETPGEEMTP